MPKFKVTGYAFVPVQIAIEVEARHGDHAKAVAFEAWCKADQPSDFIVARSHDEASVHSFSPTEAKQI